MQNRNAHRRLEVEMSDFAKGYTTVNGLILLILHIHRIFLQVFCIAVPISFSINVGKKHALLENICFHMRNTYILCKFEDVKGWRKTLNFEYILKLLNVNLRIEFDWPAPT
jgi:hypothetical protein